MSSQRTPEQAVSGAHERQQRRQRDILSPVATVLRMLLVASIVYTGWNAIRLQPWSSASAVETHASSPIQWSNVNPVGVNTFLSSEVEIWKRERTLEMVAESGAGWIRQGFPWNDIEPQKGEHWDSRYQQDAWAKYDNIVELAEKNGVRIIARLDQTPAWARPQGTDPATPPGDHEDFGDFVYDFVSRYKGRISFIQIWNEPNLAREWGGAIEPAGYASLLETAARRAREANPDIVILSAPMAMTTESSARAIDEFTYWQALYDLGVSEWFDIMSANVYGLSYRYDADPDYETLNTRRVELLRDLAVHNGDGHKSIWFNEYGWNAAPASFPPEELTWSRVDEATQAEWTAAGVDYAHSNWDWFGVANIWYFRHVGNISQDNADHYFRMVDVEFTPREVYNAVQARSRDYAVARQGTHGVLESPVTAYGSWGIVRDSTTRDGYLIEGGSGSSLAVRFQGSSLLLSVAEGGKGSLTVEIYRGTSTSGRATGPIVITIPPEGAMLDLTDGVIDHPNGEAPSTYTAMVRVTDNSLLRVEAIEVRYERSLFNLVAGTVVSGIAGLAIFGLRARRAEA